MSKNNGSSEPDQFLDIDKDALDEALVGQPRLFFKHSRNLADARLELDEAEAEFDVTKADLSLSIRDRPGKFGLGDKVTEAGIAAVLTQQQEYIDAQAKINKCKHNVAILQAVVTALDHRKRALEKLVDLHGQDYFSTPRLKGEAHESLERERMKAVVAKTRRKQRDDDE